VLSTSSQDRQLASRFRNERADPIIVEAWQTPDLKTRLKLYREVETLVNEELPMRYASLDLAGSRGHNHQRRPGGHLWGIEYQGGRASGRPDGLMTAPSIAVCDPGFFLMTLTT
jgi:hypothetical protein